MSTSRWIRLNIDWAETGWITSISPLARLVFIQVLCHVKQRGINGRCKAPPTRVFARLYDLPETAVVECLQAALDDGALAIESGDWVIPTWMKYQHTVDTTGAERQARYRENHARNGVTSVSDAVTPVSNPVTCRVTETETETVTETLREGKKTKAKKEGIDYSPEFEEWWALYPTRPGGSDKGESFGRWKARLKEGVPIADLLNGLARYVRFAEAEGMIGTRYVMQAETFLSPTKRKWEQSWELPVAETQEHAKAKAALEGW